LAAKVKTGVGVILLAWLIFFVVPTKEIGQAALFSAAAYDWIRRNAPKDLPGK
jgi:hypothetical protein